MAAMESTVEVILIIFDKILEFFFKKWHFFNFKNAKTFKVRWGNFEP